MKNEKNIYKKINLYVKFKEMCWKKKYRIIRENEKKKREKRKNMNKKK